MDFAIPPATRALLDRVRAVRDEHVVPLEEEFLTSEWRAIEPRLRAARAAVKAAGLWGPQVPRSVGGLGLSLLDHGMVSEVLGWTPLGHYCFGAQAPDAGNIEILEKFGTHEQHARWLAPLAAGDIRSCFAMTEPGTPGSNPTQLACRATRDGDDYVIDGHKWFTSAADGSAVAIVMAVTNPDAALHKRASQILVPMDAPGVKLVRNIPIMGHAGGGWASHGEVRFEGVRVPVTHRIGGEGEGFKIAQERLGPGRIHHCMRWVGIAERAFDMMCRRAATRRLDGDSRLGDKQLVQGWIAESRARIDASRLMVLEAAWFIDHGGFAEARDRVSSIKFFVANVMLDVVDHAIQAHGALGITSDTVLSWFYVHERGARIYDGPDEVHVQVVARRILDRYREDRS